MGEVVNTSCALQSPAHHRERKKAIDQGGSRSIEQMMNKDGIAIEYE